MPRVAELLRGDWREMLAHKGAAEVDLSGKTYPTCGCKLPLIEGACADCGLQLE